jgi:flagellar hook-length control protein FliK
MMIQDSSAVPQSSGGPVATGQAESTGQSFGTVLGTETAEAVTQVESAEDSSLEMGEATAVSGAEAEAAPFFMAALVDRSAAFVKSSENAELVAAAERTQELIGDWLQPRQEGEAALEEVIAAALEALEQVPDVSQGSADADSGLLVPVLSAAEAAELRQLMTVMMQHGQVAETVQGHPVVAELQKSLESTQPFVAVKDGVEIESQGTTRAAANIAVALTADGNSQAGSSAQPEVAAGLQENQIARMLVPRQDQSTDKAPLELKEQLEPGKQLESGKQAGFGKQVESGKQGDVAAMVAGEVEVDSELPSETAKPGVQSLSREIQPQQGVQVAAAQRLAAQTEGVAPKMMQLPSGQQLAESQLVDQVVTHLAGSSDGESGRMRLRLHPAELGSVRLDLIVDGDRLRAHLQAQTQQVQEVLDRYLPQLREALQQQGLKVDEFRVDVQGDRDQATEQRFARQQQQQEGSSRSPWLDEQQELEIPLQQLLRNVDGGISLRV